MAKKTSRSKKGVVQVIADGTNKLMLVFPKPTRYEGKTDLTLASVRKLLRASAKPDVQGQVCWFNCPCDAGQSGPMGVRG